MDSKEAFLSLLEEGEKGALLKLATAIMESDVLKEMAASPDVFLRVCQRDMPELADLLISHGADVNAPHEWEGQTWTPLQLASVFGKAGTVELLLTRGAELDPLFQVDPVSGIMDISGLTSSPFYLASLHGHLEVVSILTSHKPRLIKQDSICALLLAAACKGGNLDVVRKWYRPTVNINQPAEFVTSMEDCENLTALYAACEGGHPEVANYLVKELGAHLTRRVCERFPATVGAMLESCFLSRQMGEGDNSSLSMEVEALLSGQTLGAVMEEWLEPHLEALTLVDISRNQVEQLPELLPWGLPNLRRLDASHNRLACLPPPPPSPDPQLSDRLLEVNLSHNRLTIVCQELFQLPSLLTLDLSHNRLTLLGPHQHRHDIKWLIGQTMGPGEAAPKVEWRCSGLTKLDVSHNELTMLPAELSACVSLTHLTASHNKLAGLPPPWQCPLVYLDVSHNELESVPVSLDQFWTGSLRELHLDHNQLDQIRECLVKLCELSELTASHNRIEYLASPDCWACRRLTNLDLSHNLLGEQEEDRVKRNKRGNLLPRSWARGAGMEMERKLLELPPLLSHCLQELNLSHNYLHCVPPSLCDLESLQILDLSHNPGLTRLPPEMGLLVSCGQLLLEGCSIAPDSVPPHLLSGLNKTYQVISHLKAQLRNCQPCYKMKLVVMGPPERGKSTLIRLLRGEKKPEVTSVGTSTNIVQVQEWALPVAEGRAMCKPWRVIDKLGLPFLKGKQRLVLSVWELTGREEAGALHQCFMTSNSLYLLVWDIRTVVTQIRQLGQCLCNLHSQSPSCSVVVALTFADKLPLDAVKEVERQVRTELGRWEEEYSQQSTYPHVAGVCPISDEAKERLEELRQVLCDTALNMRDACNVRQKVAGRLVPGSYLTLAEELGKQRAASPYLTHSRFLKLLESLPNNDIFSQDDLPNALRFLQECGAMLHYRDELRGLSSLYILDPTWLGRVLARLMTCGEPNASRVTLVSLETALKEEGVPWELHEQIFQLLEKFDIAVQVADFSLLIPHRLPEKPPGQELPNQRQTQVARLYCLRHIPEALWSRLILRLLRAVLRFSQGHWFLGTARTPSQELPKSQESSRNSSQRGLQLRDGRVKYWRRGLCVGIGQGECVVEAVTCCGDGGLERPGILVTVQAAAEATKHVFPILGVVVDEVDDVVTDFYTGFQEINMGGVDVFAMCPSCSGDLEPGRGVVRLNGNPHFKLQSCAGAVLHDAERDLVCPVRNNCLPASELVPDLLLTELPRHFRLDPSKLQLDANPLGDGATGTVVGGTYGDKDKKQKKVAVKMFRYRQHHMNPRSLLMNTVDSQRAMNLGAPEGSLRAAYSQESGFSAGRESENSLEGATLSSTDSGQIHDDDPSAEGDDEDSDYTNVKRLRRKPTSDREESDNLKVYKAFVELRKEVAVLSKLRHPCVVEFVGACISPRLMVAMELCPLGSLRSVLQAKVKDRPRVYPHQVHDVCYPLVFGKDVTFKVIYQVAKGLAYLHKHHIIYRDLKTENILVVTLDQEAKVNIKLSDYGISKFSTAQGVQGLVGTPGYIAPEIIQGLAYNEKVDIFSFAMVMYEVMCGHLPYHTYSCMNQITRAVIKDEKRPALAEFCVVSHFPCLERVMTASWKSKARFRPSAAQIVSRMQRPHFLCQHDVISQNVTLGHVTCLAIAPDMTGKRQLLWLWVRGVDGERLCHIYNLTTSHFHLLSRQQSGHSVTCAAKVGRFMWLGTQRAEIEIYGCVNVGSPRCQKSISLPAVPTQILRLEKDAGGSSRAADVYVGLGDGTIAVVSYENPTSRQSARRTRHLEALNWRVSRTFALSEEACSGPNTAQPQPNPAARLPDRSNRWSKMSILSPQTETSSKRTSHDINPGNNTTAEEGSGKEDDSRAVRAMVVTRGGKEMWAATGCHVGVIDLASSQLVAFWSPAAELGGSNRRVVVCKNISHMAALGKSVYVAYYKSKTLLQVDVASHRITHIIRLTANGTVITRHDLDQPHQPPQGAEDREEQSDTSFSQGGSSDEDDDDCEKEYIADDEFDSDTSGSSLAREGVVMIADDHRGFPMAPGEASPRLRRMPVNAAAPADAEVDERPPPIPPKRFEVAPPPVPDGPESLPSLPPRPPPRGAPPAVERNFSEDTSLVDTRPPPPPRSPRDFLEVVPPTPKPREPAACSSSHYYNYNFGQSDAKEDSVSSSPGAKGSPLREAAGRIRPRFLSSGTNSAIRSLQGNFDRWKSAMNLGTPNDSTARSTSQAPLTRQKSSTLPTGSSRGLAPAPPLYVSSLLAVEDALWVGTSLGQVHVLCHGEPPPGYPSRHVATLPATWKPPRAAALAKTPSSSGSSAVEVSPVTSMAAVGQLVVTVSCHQGEEEEEERSDVLAWQAFSLGDFLEKVGLWQSLGQEEKLLSAKDSLDPSAS